MRISKQARQLSALVLPKTPVIRSTTCSNNNLQTSINFFTSSINSPNNCDKHIKEDLTTKFLPADFLHNTCSNFSMVKPSTLLTDTNLLPKSKSQFITNFSIETSQDESNIKNSWPEKRKFCSAFSAFNSISNQSLSYENPQEEAFKQTPISVKEKIRKKVTGKNSKSVSIAIIENLLNKDLLLKSRKQEDIDIAKNKETEKTDQNSSRNLLEEGEVDDSNKQYICHFCKKDFRRPDILSRFAVFLSRKIF